MINSIFTSYNNSDMTYTFRGFFGAGFIRHLQKKVLPSKKLNNLFKKISMTEIVVDSFFLIELKEIIKEVISEDSYFNIKVNRRSLNNLLKEIESNTWLNKDKPLGNFKLNQDLIDKTFKTKPLDFQKLIYPEYEFKKNVMGQRGMLTDAATGTGKTFLGLTLAVGCDSDVSIFIVMNKNIDTVWHKTIVEDPDDFFNIKNTNEDVYSSKNLDTGKRYNGEKYILFHYEALGKLRLFLDVLKDKKVTVVVDEVHNFTAKDTNRKNLLIEICDELKTENIILLSGTPIKGSPLEMIPYLEMLDPKYTLPVRTRYKKIYSSPNYILKKCMQKRYKNISVKIEKEKLRLDPIDYRTIEVKLKNGDRYTLDSVKEEMIKYTEIRRKEILEDMPKYVETYNRLINKVKSISKVEEALWELYHNDFKDVKFYHEKRMLMFHPELVKRVTAFEKTNILPLLNGIDKKLFKESAVILKYYSLKIAGEVLGNVFMKLRMECHRDMAEAIDYSIVDSSLAKTIVMSSYIDIIEAANTKLRKDGYNPISVYGDDTKNIKNIINTFITDDDVNPLTGTYSSISTGHHLVVANIVILLDLPFRPYLLDQAIARVNRMGQTKQVIAVFTKLNTGEEYNINSRNIDILKWAKTAVEEVTGHTINDMEFDNGSIISTVEKNAMIVRDEYSDSYDEPEVQLIKDIDNKPKVLEDKINNTKGGKTMNKTEYLIEAYNKGYFYILDWYRELFAIMTKDGDYTYVTIKNSIKYLKTDNGLVNTEVISSSPILSIYDVIKLPDDLLICQPKSIYTTIGIMIANVIFLEFPFKGKLPYINRAFTHGELCKTLPKLILKEVITVEQYLDYVDSISFSMSLNKLFVYSATKKMVTPPPGMNKYKEDMIIKYDTEHGKDWKNDPSLAVAFIEELKKFDLDYIKDDPAFGIMLSGAIVNNSRPRKFVAFGVEFGFDSSGNEATFIINSLTDGYPKDKKQLSAMYNAARKGSFDRGSGTQQAGYMVKEIQKAVNALVIVEGDCETTDGDTILVSDINKKFYNNIYIVENGRAVFKENLFDYEGKVVKVRTTQHCKIDGAFCEICAGRDMDNFKEGIQLLVITTLGVMLNSKMSAMHKASKSTMNFNILDSIH